MSSSNLVFENEIAMGAEAKIIEGIYFGYPVVFKHRYEKNYRNYGIDIKLRKERTIKEVRLLQAARELGINVPAILDVDKENWIIVMERLFADPLKFRLDSITLETYFHELGVMIAKLHNNGIVHGDLTTSNVFVDQDGRISLIDFGLGFHTQNVEDYAVDNLVLKHILESSHPLFYDKAFLAYMEGYNAEKVNFKQVNKRMKKVELRVRYRSH